MDFDLSDTHRMIQDTCRDFCNRELVPFASMWDEKSEFPKKAIMELSEMGLMGIFVPEEYGGAGMDTLSGAIAVEELSRGCASTALIMSVHNALTCSSILRFGSQAQKKKWLPDLAAGKNLGCFCLTEEEAGSDVSAISTSAKLKGDTWVLNGTKTMVTNAPEADVAIVFAKTESSISAFIVPMSLEGILVGPRDDRLGVRAASTAAITFRDVSIAQDHLLGEKDNGLKQALSVINHGRINIAAQAVGIAFAAFEAARKYAKEREQFGRPIAEHQAIQWMLADMKTELDGARMMLYRAASKDLEKSILEISEAKLFASEMAVRVSSKAIQIHGGYGYIKEFPVERCFRDAKITEIYSGTSEIQRMLIAREILR